MVLLYFDLYPVKHKSGFNTDLLLSRSFKSVIAKHINITLKHNEFLLTALS